ncbi:MAG: NifB/NifX family molybdenum-iron cluster-binding protein [Phycisphaerales bacterium]|jgi:predicted Fe-Mo cluster-binding NifX family protein
MKVAIPVGEYCGLESQVYGHFGSAPVFVLVDSETMSIEPLGNADQVHVHGQCSPMKALAGSMPDAIVVGGIGAGALVGLRHAGIKVYRAAGKTVAEVVSLLKNGQLSEVSPGDTCAGHSGGGGCHHSHD